jgi:hypothetical protein
MRMISLNNVSNGLKFVRCISESHRVEMFSFECVQDGNKLAHKFFLVGLLTKTQLENIVYSETISSPDLRRRQIGQPSSQQCYLQASARCTQDTQCEARVGCDCARRTRRILQRAVSSR